MAKRLKSYCEKCVVRLVQLIGVLGLLALSFGINISLAVANKAILGTAKTQSLKNHGRLILEFESAVSYKKDRNGTIVVLKFDQPVKLALKDVASSLKPYLSAVKLDPDGRSIRIALQQNFKINILDAGKLLYLDVLGRGWRGLPPSFPPSVIRELARKAQGVEAKEKALARQKLEAQGYAEVQMRLGQQPGFTRLVFDWNKFVPVAMNRQGDEVNLIFEANTDLDVWDVNQTKPRGLTLMRARKEKGRLKVQLQLAKNLKVKAFREDEDYIVDLMFDAPKNAGQWNVIVKHHEDMVAAQKPPKPESNDVILPNNKRRVEPPKVTPAPLLEELRRAAGPPQAAKPIELKVLAPQKKPTPSSTPILAQTPKPASKLNAPQMPKKPLGRVSASLSRPMDKVLGTVGLSQEDYGLDVMLKKPTPAAIFQRDNVIWMVFSTMEPLSARSLILGQKFSPDDLSFISMKDAQIVRLTLHKNRLWYPMANGSKWSLVFDKIEMAQGGKAAKPVGNAVSFERLASSGNGVRLRARLNHLGQVHKVQDPTQGDDLHIVTLAPKQKAYGEALSFVDMQMLATKRGLVIVPKTSKLDVLVDPPHLFIGRPGGLRLSSLDEMNDAQEQSLKLHSSTRATPVDFERWGTVGEEPIYANKVHKIEATIAAAKPFERNEIRKSYAQFMLANGLGAESNAILTQMIQEDPELANRPEMKLMQGMSYVMSWRAEDAIKALSVGRLAKNQHAALWRATAHQMLENWKPVLEQFRYGQDALSLYPSRQRAKFHLAAAQAALHLGALKETNEYLSRMPRHSGDRFTEGVKLLVSGQYRALRGEPEKALDYYARAAKTQLAPVEAQAHFLQTNLALKMGKIKPSEAIDQLEGQNILWRGDHLELLQLATLAKLYAKEDQFKQAFQTMERSLRAFPKSEQARNLQHKMQSLFNRLYLDNEADRFSPIKALSLFYDYRNMVPPGAIGDRMIRNLSTRLIDVDLLHKAIELLDYQIKERLRGAARAQVASRLAMVHLLDRKPINALKVLGQTRQPGLPKSVRYARDLLEARALAQLGRIGQTVEILNRLDSFDAAKLRAEAFWIAKKWPEAAEQLELNIAQNWSENQPLSEEDRLNVLRMAIGYTLGEEPFALRRIAEKFGTQMTGSAQEASFKILTSSWDSGQPDNGLLAREIASIDTMDSFLKDFRKRYDRTEPDETTPTGAVP